MAKKVSSKGVRITRELLAKALTWHCSRYTKQAASSSSYPDKSLSRKIVNRK